MARFSSRLLSEVYDKMTAFPFSYPVFVMAKPIGAACNMRCEYCYYIEKQHTLSASPTVGMMDDSTLDAFIRQYLDCQTQREVLFIWHGGEPLLCGIDFFRKAIFLQQKYARGRIIDNCIQTNATLLTDEWCRFLADNRWLVGVSIDGPEHLHDAFRRMKGGSPSFSRVMHGIELLNNYGVEWNVLATINSVNAKYADECYTFLRSLGTQFLQFTPVVERHLEDGRLAKCDDETAVFAPFSVSADDFGRFVCRVFDRWVSGDIGSVFVRLIEDTLANWCGVKPGTCSLADSCGFNVAMESNGDVYSCDHFTFPEYRLGNINRNTVTELVYGEAQKTFRQRKLLALPQQCKACKWLFTCHGECPRNRFVANGNDHKLNYLCVGYSQFFTHVAPYMTAMKQLITEGKNLPNALKL